MSEYKVIVEVRQGKQGLPTETPTKTKVFDPGDNFPNNNTEELPTNLPTSMVQGGLIAAGAVLAAKKTVKIVKKTNQIVGDITEDRQRQREVEFAVDFITGDIFSKETVLSALSYNINISKKNDSAAYFRDLSGNKFDKSRRKGGLL